MRDVLIIGTGALATLFAARLSSAGAQVTMLGTWREGLDALREHGARLMMPDGVIREFPVRVTDAPSKIPAARYALVLVKSWQTERAALMLKDCLAGDGLALTLQNGLENSEILTQTLGLQCVSIGVTTTGATLLEPGLARLGGEGTISLESHRRLPPLDSMLGEAGFDVQVVDDARSLLWGKLVINAAINPLTALLRVPNGELLQRPAARQLMAELAKEAATVGIAHGVSLPFEDPVAAVESVAWRTAANHSSMLQDVLRGAPTEIHAICGAIVRKGDEKGISVPVNQIMLRLLEALHTET